MNRKESSTSLGASPEPKKGELPGFQDEDLLSGLKRSEIDAIPLYLREIGNIRLLTAEEEVELAMQIEKANEASLRLKSDKNLSSQKKRDLEEIAQDGELARKRLTKANTRLVVSIAKKYRGRGLPFSDLIQEGNIGLMRAVDKFDYTLGYKFSSYAIWWVRQAVTQALAFQARTIRLPMHVVEALNRTARVSSELEKRFGREPTPKEIAEKMSTTVEKVEELRKVDQWPLSLEKPVGDKEEASEFGDFIEDKEALHPLDIASEDIAGERLREVVNSLPEREGGVLILRFGLDGNGSRTLGEVGEIYGVSRERVRQIEAKALEKLRHPSRSRKLRGYL